MRGRRRREGLLAWRGECATVGLAGTPSLGRPDAATSGCMVQGVWWDAMVDGTPQATRMVHDVPSAADAIRRQGRERRSQFPVIARP